jgi:carbon-monoxide dehydrogenase large subunit
MGFMAAPRTVQEARVRLEPDGSLTVFTSQQPHGQSHETTLAQLAADELSVPMERVKVVHGDTDVTPFNLVGTGGSRAATLASGAVIGAARAVRSRVLDAASKLLEIAPDDLEIIDGSVAARGAPTRAIKLDAVAAATYLQPGLVSDDGALGIEVRSTFISGEGTWSQATHACTVSVDVETGRVSILRYVVVEDCGSIVNPAVVDGQIRGGVAQGIGAVLLEHAAYSDDGQYLAGTFLDYLLPTATDIPTIEIHHLESEPIAEINFRGVGEGGAIGAPAALTNAIEDALAPFGVRIREQHLPPRRIAELCGFVCRPPQQCGNAP